jgi:protein-L-isoaspartate(D-aspartate) O-methyltransferase
VPRELFLPEYAKREGLEAVYRDQAIPTKFDSRGFAISSSSQPAVMAVMLAALDLQPGMRVLEIGAGTGYNAALLSLLVGSAGNVMSVDIDAQVARTARAALRAGGYPVKVVVGDGHEGCLEGAPYDRIIVTASSETVPRPWFDQLVEGGLVEVPLRITAPGDQVIVTLRKTPTGFATAAVIEGGFMPLRTADGTDPTPVRQPFLAARDGTISGPHPPLRLISGQALAKLSAPAKRRLLSISLEDPARRATGVRAPLEALSLYLALTLPKARAVRVNPGWSVGLISRDGASLAYISIQGKRSTNSLHAHGTRAAADELLDAIGSWDARGRPGVAELKVSIDYAKGQERLRTSWAERAKTALERSDVQKTR